MKTLKSLLQKKYLKKDQISKTSIDDKTVFFIFRKVIKTEYGRTGLEKFKAEHFSKKTLCVKTNSSAWAAELWTNRSVLIKKINYELNGDYINKIKIN